MIAVTKLRIFDIPLSVNGFGSEGYEKPKKAHIAKKESLPSCSLAETSFVSDRRLVLLRQSV